MNKLMMLASLGCFAAGCAHEAVLAPKPATEAPQAAAGPVAPAPAMPKACSLDSDCGSGQLCLSNTCVDITPNLAECSAAKVHFDYDRSDIQSQDKADLDRMARCLRADNAFRVKIEGNCDERGTEDYNLHLGDRRAGSVDRYLANLGVPGSQMSTISYGKDQPVCSEHDEACWSQNRRAALNPSLVATNP
jgi:peptidoglycan-associated lipoprotein